MSVQQQTATLLIITSETSEAERLITVLREDGLAVQSVTLPHVEHLDTVIVQRACDLILCCGHDRSIDLDSVLAAYRRLEADLPLIVIEDEENHVGNLIKARRGGARDVIRRHENEHLKLAVSRELTDLHRRREASGLSQRLRLCEQRDRELIHVTSAGVSFVQDGLHLDANPAYLKLFGYPDLDALQAIPFLDLFVPEQQKQIRDLLRGGDHARLAEPLEFDVTCQHADDSQFTARLLVAPSEIDSEPCLRVIVHADHVPVAEFRVDQAAEPAVSEIRHAAGLARLLANIESHVNQTRIVERPFVIFYLRVKCSTQLLNDLGFIQGLKKFDDFAGILATVVAEDAFLARVSDDGFCLIVDGLNEFDAKAFAARIIADAHFPIHATAKDTGGSDCEIGYFLVRDRAAAAEDIVNAAHRLCISHNQAAISAVSLAARNKQDGEESDVSIAHKIDYALSHDQLKLVYQPIISLMGDNQENYSVLMRLFDEDEHLLEARDFIGPAIRSGLIEEVDKWAIRAAIQVISEQRRAGHNINLFVNLSEDTFRNPNIVLWICDCLREFDVRGNWLTFQFQEELVTSNLASIGKLIETLKKIKCRIAVNRFGVLERPELLLQGLSLDFVLLEAGFAQGLADDQAKQQRLVALAALTHEFNVKSIVTGVEDARSLTVLWTAGVDYVQGNFLQRPSATIELQT